MSETPKPPGESGQLKVEFRGTLNRAIQESQTRKPADVVARQVEVGILGPIETFEDMGFSSEERTVIERYSQVASNRARKEFEREASDSPLFALDEMLRVGVETIKSTGKDEIMVGIRHARAELRKTQNNIKIKQSHIVERAIREGKEAPVGDDLIDALCSDEHRVDESTNYWSTTLLNFAKYNYGKVGREVSLLIDSGEAPSMIAEAAQDLNLNSTTKTLSNVPTKLPGVFGQYDIMRSYGDTKIYYHVSFSKDAVRRIVGSENLAPLPQER